ncbi:Glutamine amidotransferase [Vibrio crassostreae]|uniref:chorismate-binding protein n=1 Tax=Vibrio crassostreae TaxID=246167 RepID=UPI00104CE7EC|nr:chorismate-binding protein [Vibrio crassostreae]TCN75903.1 phenazine biosynthesis protein phzE [Vibrio crassostreae]CAK2533119.1 Glutamine amidotransferase [Vibrio crassostreae]CAK3889289.1 Glutamine amidotransferase [Vibrio crassostreae]
MNNLLSSIISNPEKPFAIIYRPTTDSGMVDLYQCSVDKHTSINEAIASTQSKSGKNILLLPFRQVIENNYNAIDDEVPLLSLAIEASEKVSVDEFIHSIPDVPVNAKDERFNLKDQEYCCRVRDLIDHEIGQGAGSNFVLQRKFHATIDQYEPSKLFSLIRNLLNTESSAYWIFLIQTGDQAFIGASPELHASLNDGEVMMNPISGTYTYPSDGPMDESILSFLSCRKEIGELSMVVDEELKMMSRLCEAGGQVSALKLKQLSRVAHTEYILSGQSDASIAKVLKETLPAPTVTGSPIQNACDVISRFEPEGRRYYSGVVAFVEKQGESTVLDSAILIRTAEISQQGQVEITAGATIVKDSIPVNEANETRSKVASLYHAMFDSEQRSNQGRCSPEKPPILLNDIPGVQELLERRSSENSNFWRTEPNKRNRQYDYYLGKQVLIIDGNDTFTSMLKTLFTSVGAIANVVKVADEIDFSSYDLVLAGPGPGNPKDKSDRRVLLMQKLIQRLIEAKHPFFAVCLSHQLLANELGLQLIRLNPSNQGLQKTITLGNQKESVGFYNTFCAKADDMTALKMKERGVDLYFDELTHHIYAIQSNHFASVQFHLESFLTINGPQVLDYFVKPLLDYSCSKEAEVCAVL